MTKEHELANWPTGLCDCFSDIEICEQGRQPCVLFDKNAKELGMLQDENPSAIYCCMCFGAYGLCGLIWLIYSVVSAYSRVAPVRTELRRRAGLKAAPCNDCLVVYCCGPCATCQEARVLKALKAGQAMHTPPPAQVMSKDVDGHTSTPDPKLKAAVMMPPRQQAVA